jgi:nucleoside-diphosphate-sugar epimerase
VLAKTQSSSRVIFLDAVEDDPQQRRPDITRARSLLGWEPVVALSEGLDHMISYFSQELGCQPIGSAAVAS